MEIWRDIPNTLGVYQVSESGKVRSVTRSIPRVHTGRLLKLTPNARSGYLQVTLSLQGRKCIKYVHDLVLGAFVGPKPDGLEVCHCDDNPRNNRLSNLRYDTRSANHADMQRNGGANYARGEVVGSAKLDDFKVRWIRDNAYRFSQRAMAATLGVLHRTVGDVLSGKSWGHVK